MSSRRGIPLSLGWVLAKSRSLHFARFRFASVGMTKSRLGDKERHKVPPLRSFLLRFGRDDKIEDWVTRKGTGPSTSLRCRPDDGSMGRFSNRRLARVDFRFAGGNAVFAGGCIKLVVMPKRCLQIVKKTPTTIGVCERCNAQFTSSLADPETDIAAQFNAHKCHRKDAKRNAPRMVRDATEDRGPL